MSIISGFNKVKNYVKTTEGYKLLSRWTSSDTVDVGGKTLTEVVNELGTASKKDVAESGNASTTQVVMGDDTRLTDSRKASDVSAWAKASTKPTYTASEVGLGNVGNFKAVSTVASQGLTDTEKSNARANIGAQVAGSYASSSHSHDDRYYTESEIDSKLNDKANTSHGNHVPSTQTADNATFLRNDNTWAKVTPANIGAQPAGSYASASHTHDNRYYTETEVDTKLGGKANSSHTHTIANITNLQTTLDGKAASNHSHTTVNGHTVNSDVPANAKFTDTNTWTALKGATTSAAGTAGYAPAPSAGAANRYLRSDGTWSVPPDTNTTYDIFVKSGSGAKSGLVPTPSTTAGTSKFLREDGTWSNPPTAAVMTGATASANGSSGLVPQPVKGDQSWFLRGDGKWAVPSNTWRGISSTYTSKITDSTTTSLSQEGAYNLYTELNGNLKINSITSIVKSDVINKIVIWQNYTIGNIFVGTFSITVGASNLAYNDCIIATGFPKPFNGDVPVYAKSTSHIYQCTITKNGELKTLWTDAAIQANSNIMLETCYVIKNS